MIFIGPPPDAIVAMGDKVEARKLMTAAGVPVVPGSPGYSGNRGARCARSADEDRLSDHGEGGGRRRRQGHAPGRATTKTSPRRCARVASEAKSSFGDGRSTSRNSSRKPRHVEIQVFADKAGNTVHLFERECSIQRRIRRWSRNRPSPFVAPEMRARWATSRCSAAQAVNYVGAGTIEFLVDADRNFYFLEMNTRIQVEHPVTEMVTGLDLVRLQIEVAAGAKLPFKQSDLKQNGWAVECRIYAEDPAAGFVPAPGKIETLKFPEGPGVRNDAGVYAGAEVTMFYDPMISKLAVWGSSRMQAIERMRRALAEFQIAGELTTNLDFHRWIMKHPRFLAGEFDTNFINQEWHPEAAPATEDLDRLAATVLAAHAAQTHQNHSNGQPAEAQGPRVSPWKTRGRLGNLR